MSSLPTALKLAKTIATAICKLNVHKKIVKTFKDQLRSNKTEITRYFLCYVEKHLCIRNSLSTKEKNDTCK